MFFKKKWVLDVALNVVEIVTSTPKLTKPERLESQRSGQDTYLDSNDEDDVNTPLDIAYVGELPDPFTNGKPMTPALQSLQTVVGTPKFDNDCLEPPSFLADKIEFDSDINKHVTTLNPTDGIDGSEKLDKQEKEQIEKMKLNTESHSNHKVSPVQSEREENTVNGIGENGTPCLTPVVRKTANAKAGEFVDEITWCFGTNQHSTNKLLAYLTTFSYIISSPEPKAPR